MNKRKLLITSLISLIVILLSGAIIYAISNKEDVLKKSEDSKKGKIVKIDFDKFQNLVLDEKRVIILFSEDGCPHCKKVLETLDDVISKNDFTIYNYDLLGVIESEAEYIRSIVDLKTVPLMVVLENKKEVARLSGVNDYDEIVSFIKENKKDSRKEDNTKFETEKNEDKELEKKDFSKIEKLLQENVSDYYENKYYNLIGNSEVEKAKFLEKYSEIGLKINLDNLIKASEEYANNLKEVSDTCDKQKTIVFIYPKNPYGKMDYDLKVQLSCD